MQLEEKELESLAEKLNLSKDEMLREGLKYFLERKLREIRTEIYKIRTRYGVSTVDDLYKKGEVGEKDTWLELQRLDHLEFKKDEFEKALRLLSWIQLKDIAGIEFGDIVEDVLITDSNQMKIFIKDDSFVDVWYSLKIKERYSYHWERKHIDRLIYRHDNAPHKKWQYTTTFPKHFHEGEEDVVTESDIHETPHEGLREFLCRRSHRYRAGKMIARFLMSKPDLPSKRIFES